ncbi:MAG: type IV pilin [Halobacteriota archaeon]
MRTSSRNRTDRAVSPVLGVVLLVGITVLLSAAIAGVVLGLGAGPALPPQVDWSFAYDGEGNLTIRHAGGEPIDPADVRVEGDPVQEPGRLADQGTWQVGNQTVVAVDPTDVDDPDVILIWEGGDSTGHVLAEFSLQSS